MGVNYLSWRCNWLSAESAARAAWENSEELYKQLKTANQRIVELEGVLRCMVNEFELDALGGVMEDGECFVIDKARAALGELPGGAS